MNICADPSTTTSRFLDEKDHIQEGRSMLLEATKNKLKELKLEAMIEAWEAHSGNPQMLGLSFDERLGLLVDAQYLSVHNKRIHRARKEAKLRLHTAMMEAVETSESRNLSRAAGAAQLVSVYRTESGGADHWSDGNWQDIPVVCAGRTGVSKGIPRAVCEAPSAAGGAAAGARRWHVRSSAGTTAAKRPADFG